MSFVRSGYNFKVNVNHQSCVIIFKNAEGQIKADFSEQMWYLFFLRGAHAKLSLKT